MPRQKSLSSVTAPRFDLSEYYPGGLTETHCTCEKKSNRSGIIHCLACGRTFSTSCGAVIFCCRECAEQAQSLAELVRHQKEERRRHAKKKREKVYRATEKGRRKRNAGHRRSYQRRKERRNKERQELLNRVTDTDAACPVETHDIESNPTNHQEKE